LALSGGTDGVNLLQTVCAMAFDSHPSQAGDAKGPGMEDNFEKYAVAVIITFGALILGGLMAAAIGFRDRDAFLFALGAATIAWIAGHAMIFDMPRLYAALIGFATLMAMASTLALVL
jgi:hypothetical protein